MADTVTPGISGQLPFYKSPEPLSAEKHGKLGIVRRDDGLKFAHTANVVPITIGEFGPAALCYPIIFAGSQKAPLAVMGLRKDENLYINDKGELVDDYYVPSFIRRYPFVFAEDKAQGNFVVCVDTGSDLVSDKPDQPFFENGQPTDFTNQAIEFLKNFESQRQTTMRYVKELEELDLFELKEVNISQQLAGESEPKNVKVADYYGISEEKLKRVPAAKLAEMRDSGALMSIHVHLLSLMNWQRVIARATRQADA